MFTILCTLRRTDFLHRLPEGSAFTQSAYRVTCLVVGLPALPALCVTLHVTHQS